MYKNVGKRILAVFMSVCMLLGIADFSAMTVRAEDEKKNLSQYRIVLKQGGTVVGSTNTPSYNGMEYEYEITYTGTDGVTDTITKDNAETKGVNIQVRKGNQVVEDRSIKNAGTYNITVTADASSTGYEGSTSFSNIRINSVPLSSSDFQFVGSNEVKIGEGEGHPVLKLSDTYDYLVLGDDYVINYGDYSTVGNKKVTVSAGSTGNCTITRPISLDYKVIGKTIESIEGVGDSYYLTNQDPSYDLIQWDTDNKLSVKGENNYYLGKGEYEVIKKSGNPAQPGKMEYTVKGKGDYEGSEITVTYDIKKNMNYPGNEPRIDKFDLTSTYTGGEIKRDGMEIYDGNVKLYQGQHFSLEYSDDCTNVGEKKVIIKFGADGCSNPYYEGTIEKTYTIQPANLNDTVVTVPSVNYTGQDVLNDSAWTNSIEVKLNNQLIDQSEYKLEITQENHVDVEQGTRTLRILPADGNNNFTGVKEVSFQINARPLSESYITVEDTTYEAGLEQSGGIKTEVTVKDDLDATLVAGKDYTLAYENNTGAGTARVRIIGIGNYSGTVVKNFTINQRSINDMSFEVPSGFDETPIYTGLPINQDNMVITYQKDDGTVVTLKRNDYTIQYDGERTSVTGQAVPVTILGQGNYTGSKQIKTFTIQKQSIDLAAEGVSDKIEVSLELPRNPATGNYTTTYTTQNIVPKVILRHRQGTSWNVVNETDSNGRVNYSLAWTRNINVTTGNENQNLAEVTITGDGNYEGSTNLYFEITQMDLSQKQNSDCIQILLTSTDVGTSNNGKQFVPLASTAPTPTFSLTYKIGDYEFPMEEGRDYKIKERDGYINNTEPGIGTIQLEGIGNFKGAFTQEFIIKGNLQRMKVTANQQVYTGDEIKLEDKDLQAVYEETVDNKKVTKELHLGADFQLDYREDDKNNINVGTARAYVATLEKENEDVYYYMPNTGGQNENIVEFQIVPKNITDKTDNDIDIIPEYEKDQVYTGKPIYPKMKITYRGHEMKQWVSDDDPGDYKILKDEDVKIRNNVDITGTDEAFITIQGTGNNFVGTRKIYFTILPRDISDEKESGTQFITVPEDKLNPEKDDPTKRRIWINEGEIKISELSFDYAGTTVDGEDIAFASGTGAAADGTMQEGRDYEISYRDNNQVGVATLVITGKGNFIGTVERNFNIWGDLNTYKENVQIDIHANKVYNGEKQILGPNDIDVYYFTQKIPFENYVITNSGEAIEGDDINATKTHGAEDDVNVRVHVSISADDARLEDGSQNLFFGGKVGGETLKETFAIAQKPVDDIKVEVKGINPDGYTYTGDPINPAEIAPPGDTKGFRLMYNGMELKEVSETTMPGGDTGEGEETPPEVIVTGDYRVELVANTDVPEADASENEKPHFYIQAREDGNYSGTRMVHFTINPQSINAGDLHIRYRTVDANGTETWYDMTEDEVLIEYQAKHQNREIRLENELDSFGIFYGDRQLYPRGSVDDNNKLRRPDYEITYENNRKPGTATFKLKGLGNYADDKSINFKIRGNLADAVIANIPAQPFNQDGVEPEIKVTYFGQELVAGVDYNIADYINNDQVTRANTKDLPAVIIQGIKDGGFEGTESSKQFNIIPRNLSIAENQVGMSLTGLADYYDYTGSPVEPDVAQLMLCYNGKAVKNGTNEFQFVRYGQNINGGNFEENGTNAPYIEITGTPYNPDIPGSGNYTGSMRFYFTIKGVSLEDRSTFTIEMEGTVPETGDQYYYTGRDINPTVIVRQEGRPEPLVEGEDYRLEYTGDLKTVGSNDATVIIKGINNYSDTRTAPFMIVGRDISAFPDEFNVYIPAQIYTGESIRPQAEDVIVTRLIGDEEITLEMDTDYILGNCENNINVGEGTIEVIGIGNYSGTVKAPFWIQPLDIDINDVMIEGVEDRVYNTLEQVQNVKVTWQGQMLPPNTYELSYSADHTNAGKASIIVTLLGNYSGSKAVDFTIASLPLTDSAISVSNIPNQVYSGKPITPALEITYQAPNQRASVKLVQNKDYRLTYTGNQEVGINTAKVTITGIGNYAGELQKTFTIIGSLAQAEVEAIPTQNYTGKEITPSPAVRLGGRTLEAGKDYTLAYANNIEAGKASITITGTGTEFGGSKVVNFDICRDVSAGLQVVGLVNAYLYTGTPVVPPLGKVTAYGKTLMPEKDYKVTVSNNINAGTASIQIEGIGYYKGSKTFQFNIVKRSIAQATVSKIATVNFNTKAQKPALTVKYGSTTLKEGTDYSLKYSNNKFPGKAIVMITGKGNMTGAKVVNFTIKMPSISGAAKATPSSTTKIKISWKKQDLASGYQIFDSKNKLIKTVKGGTKTSYTVSGLKAGKTYSFKVRYYNETDKRKCYSNFTKTVKTSTKPAAPKITLKSKKSKQATISWKKISGASGYEIYRSTKSKSGFKKIATTSKTSYTNTKLTSKKRYYYRVRAYRTVNGTKIYSSYSTTKYVTIK